MYKTPAQDQELESWNPKLMGMLRWMLQIGRVDIITEVSMMAYQMDIPSEGHLEAVLHVFAFICQNYNSRMAFDPT